MVPLFVPKMNPWIGSPFYPIIVNTHLKGAKKQRIYGSINYIKCISKYSDWCAANTTHYTDNNAYIPCTCHCSFFGGP